MSIIEGDAREREASQPVVSIEIELAQGFGAAELGGVARRLAEGLNDIVRDLWLRKLVSASSQELPLLLNSAQLLENCANLIQGGMQQQSRIAQPGIIPTGMGPQRMN